MEYEVVKLYYENRYTGWQVAKPHESQGEYDVGYFIKVEGLYFKLGEENDSTYVDESE